VPDGIPAKKESASLKLKSAVMFLLGKARFCRGK